MAGLRSLWRAWAKGCLGSFAFCCLILAGPALAPSLTVAQAQEAAGPILTIDQDRIFVQSAFGKASLDRERVAAKALEDQNRAIEADLVAEEQDLTAKRKTTPPVDFAALASAFDQKVESIRAAQDAKFRDLGRAREADRVIFRREVVPVLGKLMSDKGAVAIIDRTLVVLSLPVIDVTDEAIVRIDAALGAGEIAPLADPTAGAPDKAPDKAPAEPPATP